MKRFCALFLALFALSAAAAQNRWRIPSLNFEEAGRFAAAASVELQNLRSRYALREGAWKWSLRSFLPQLSITVSEDERLSLTSADSFTKTWSANLEQLVFDGGKTRASRNAERAELILFIDELKQNESSVIETALASYRGILSSRMLIAIREEALVSLREQRRILAEELALGMVIPLDLVQAEITVREAELELESMQIQHEEQEKQFAELLGLGELPELSEQVDIRRSPFIPGAEAVHRAALSNNSALKRFVHSIAQKEIEAKSASRTWIPSLKALGTYSLSGQHYPLTRQSWTLGFSINFASPWFSAGSGGSAGWELPYDKTVRLQSSATPLPDPAAALSAKQARLALALEQDNYRRALSRLGREAELEVNKIRLSEQARGNAVEALELGAEKYRISEVLLSLGRITRVELMEERLEYAKKEAAAVEAAIALMEAERSLERLADLPPASLRRFFAGARLADE